MPGYIRIFVISCAILVVSQCENQSITQQQSNVVHHVRAEQCSYDVPLQPLALGQEFQSATIGRIRHCKPSSRPSWELRHNITTYRPVNPRHIETWQFNYTPRSLHPPAEISTHHGFITSSAISTAEGCSKLVSHTHADVHRNR